MDTLSRFQITLIRAVLVAILLPASCAGPPFLYYYSPWLLIDKADIDKDSLFHVAFYTSKAGGKNAGKAAADRQFVVAPYSYALKESKRSTVRFHLAKPEIRYQFGDKAGEGGADVKVLEEKKNTQVIQIFSAGDSPWTTLSVYRVTDNKVTPLRFARSNVWILVAWPFVFALFYFINKKLASLEEKKYEGPDPPQFFVMFITIISPAVIESINISL